MAFNLIQMAVGIGNLIRASTELAYKKQLKEFKNIDRNRFDKLLLFTDYALQLIKMIDVPNFDTYFLKSVQKRYPEYDNFRDVIWLKVRKIEDLDEAMREFSYVLNFILYGLEQTIKMYANDALIFEDRIKLVEEEIVEYRKGVETEIEIDPEVINANYEVQKSKTTYSKEGQ